MEVKELITMVSAMTKDNNERNIEQHLILILECIEKTLQSGESITLPLFGTFIREEEMANSCKEYKVVFEPNDALKKRINRTKGGNEDEDK